MATNKKDEKDEKENNSDENTITEKKHKKETVKNNLSKTVSEAELVQVIESSEDEINAAIEQDRQELTPEQQRHLFSHEKINADNVLNSELYRSIKSYKQVTITFSNLRENSKVFISLRSDQEAIWSEGDQSNRLVGLSLSTTKDAVLFVSSFLVNAREILIQTYDFCAEIKVQLYVLTDQSFVKGRVDLPPQASVTFQSLNDRTTVTGLSSFAIDVD